MFEAEFWVAVATILRGPGWVFSVMLDVLGGRTTLGSEDVFDADRPDDRLGRQRGRHHRRAEVPAPVLPRRHLRPSPKA